MSVLRIEKRRNKPLVVLSLTALAAASLCAPSLALAQQDAGASRAPIELSPMRVTTATTVLITEPIVIEGGSSSSARDAGESQAEPRRAADGRAIDNPFGASATDTAPTAHEPPEDHAPSDDDDDDRAGASDRRRPSRDRVYRCAPGQRSYFDERSALFRPCTDNSGPPRVRVDRSPNARAGWRAAATASCRNSGVRSYFDPVEQLYRPCPSMGQPVPLTQSSDANPREPRPTGARVRCSPGQHSYFDPRSSLYRPCQTQ